jgi:TRAP transporter TAXI family solute receptor
MAYYELCAPARPADCYKSWEAVGARFVRGSYAEQADVFVDRKVDGVFAFLAPPAAAVSEVSQGRRLTLLGFSSPLLDHLAAFGLGRAVIPAGTYLRAGNADDAVMSATMSTTIIVSADMAPDLAYLLTRTINDHADRGRQMHESLADYDPARAQQRLGGPLHPGAERYYREKGWLE